MQKYAEKFAEKSGSYLHPDRGVTETVVEGLARHIEEVGVPLCPCNFYPDKPTEAKLRRWRCACDEMQMYKYCHCLLFVNKEGVPITEYLPGRPRRATDIRARERSPSRQGAGNATQDRRPSGEEAHD